ncbi:IS3 family transposase, partial [Niallia circulans]
KERHFTSLEELSRELYDYVNWFNYIEFMER